MFYNKNHVDVSKFSSLQAKGKCKKNAVWPDLAKIRQLGEISKSFGHFLSNSLVFGKIVNLHWQIFYSFGQFVIVLYGQFEKINNHLVTVKECWSLLRGGEHLDRIFSQMLRYRGSTCKLPNAYFCEYSTRTFVSVLACASLSLCLCSIAPSTERAREKGWGLLTMPSCTFMYSAWGDSNRG